MQLELWNDTPEPWQRKMERDAFRIAFPDEELGPNDTVEVKTTWHDATESWACGEGTCYEEGQDAAFTITVRWQPKWKDPRAGTGRGTRVYFGAIDPGARIVFFEGEQAVNFWMKLMRGA